MTYPYALNQGGKQTSRNLRGGIEIFRGEIITGIPLFWHLWYPGSKRKAHEQEARLKKLATEQALESLKYSSGSELSRRKDSNPMNMRKSALVFAALFVVSTLALAADEFKIDKVHSNVGFSVKHMVISTVPGRFTDFDGTIVYDDQDLTKSSVKVTIQAASINTDNANRDNDLRGDSFLDTAKYPTITFVSKQVKKAADGSLVAVGTLTIKDVSKEIELPFTINGKIKAFGGERMAAEAHTKINRQEYHLSFNKMIEAGPMVGDDVTINLNVEAARPLPKPAGKPSAQNNPPPSKAEAQPAGLRRHIKVNLKPPKQKPAPQNTDPARDGM
jgi:polyisoprenoid-binding protein YceI